MKNLLLLAVLGFGAYYLISSGKASAMGISEIIDTDYMPDSIGRDWSFPLPFKPPVTGGVDPFADVRPPFELVPVGDGSVVKGTFI